MREVSIKFLTDGFLVVLADGQSEPTSYACKNRDEVLEVLGNFWTETSDLHPGEGVVGIVAPGQEV